MIDLTKHRHRGHNVFCGGPLIIWSRLVICVAAWNWQIRRRGESHQKLSRSPLALLQSVHSYRGLPGTVGSRAIGGHTGPYLGYGHYHASPLQWDRIPNLKRCYPGRALRRRACPRASPVNSQSFRTFSDVSLTTPSSFIHSIQKKHPRFLAVTSF